MWPLTTKLPSEHNGTLEVTWYNGKKLLDTKNANYSYGLLQQVLETGLKEIEFNKVHSVLLLGLGGGSVIASLRHKFKYPGPIHAVEIDQTIIDLAHKEFSISTSDMLTIERADAASFVRQHTRTYGLVLVDLFIDTKVPGAFLSEAFCEKLLGLCDGYILFNLGMNLTENDQAHQVPSFFRKQLQHKVLLLDNVLERNTLLIVEKSHSKLKDKSDGTFFELWFNS